MVFKFLCKHIMNRDCHSQYVMMINHNFRTTALLHPNYEMVEIGEKSVKLYTCGPLGLTRAPSFQSPPLDNSMTFTKHPGMSKSNIEYNGFSDNFHNNCSE